MRKMTPPCKHNSDVPTRAVYAHVPFCRARCRYCDFYSVPAPTGLLASRYVRGIVRELAQTQDQYAAPLGSVFIGGGTPTALPADLLGTLLGAFAPLCDADTEFTLEANPGTISDTAVAQLLAGGVNRVSLGAQSFIPEELELLGRIHTASQIAEAVTTLRSAGIGNLSLDLIFGIPGQTAASWARSLDEALALEPDHLSCYALSMPAGTALARMLDNGEITAVDDDLQREFYDQAVETLERAGLAQYEISNFARPGKQCKHNLVYWHNQSYVGLGPSAAGYCAGVRRTTTAEVHAWLQAVEADTPPPAESEALTGRDMLAETAMLTLRLVAGIDRKAFRQRFGEDIVEAFPRTFTRYAALGAVEITDDAVRIAQASLFVANAVLADLLDEIA